MRKRIEQCVQFKDRRKIVSVQEKGKNFKLINNLNPAALIACIRIDGCVFESGGDGIRCDYLFEVDILENNKKVYFIELKGTDLIKAIRQVYSTLLALKNLYSGCIYEARIVMGSVPNISNRREYIQLHGFVKGTGGTIVIRNRKYEESL